MESGKGPGVEWHRAALCAAQYTAEVPALKSFSRENRETGAEGRSELLGLRIE